MDRIGRKFKINSLGARAELLAQFKITSESVEDPSIVTIAHLESTRKWIKNMYNFLIPPMMKAYFDTYTKRD